MKSDSLSTAREPLIPTQDVHSDPVSTFLRNQFSKPSLKTYLFVTISFGIVTGILAAFYNASFQTALQLVWGIRGEIPHGWFEKRMMSFPSMSIKLGKPVLESLADAVGTSLDRVAFLYIPLMSTLFGALAGVVQSFMGFPGDLPNTVGYVHKMEAVPIKQLPSMFLCSICSIVSGGSLGPEAPLLAMCASTASYLSEKVLGHKRQLLRDCTLIGMASGLAAFFGVGLGGALFAFEVAHRTGLQFFECITFGVSSGMITLLVFRGILGLKFGPIWEFGESSSSDLEFQDFIAGILMGVIMAGVAILFIKMHKLINKLLLAMSLQEHQTPIKSGCLGGFVIGLIAALLPPTMFWSEFEINNMADEGHELTHIWPLGGIWGTDPFSGSHYPGWLFLLIGLFKLVAISVTVLSGLRGGFIFPLMFAGASFGRAVLSIPHLPILSSRATVLMAMAGSAGLNASITRTPFASSLILVSLSGHLEILPAVLCTALVSFFITIPFEFIKTQKYRSDLLSIDSVISRDAIEHDGKQFLPVVDGKHGEDSMRTKSGFSDGSKIKAEPLYACSSTDTTISTA